MIITVDSNIVISSLINSKGKEFSILKRKYKQIDFVTSIFLTEEVTKKTERIAYLTTSPATEVQFQFESLTSEFIFVNDRELVRQTIVQTEKIMKGLDPKDFLFVAVTIYFDSLLWTGDLRLAYGLKRNGINNIITTKELTQIIKGL
jgi:predicted nucleic acid-binding protein